MPTRRGFGGYGGDEAGGFGSGNGGFSDIMGSGSSMTPDVRGPGGPHFGNKETSRELAGPQSKPNTIGPSGIPRGVTVQDSGTAGPESPSALFAPVSPLEPSPVSSRNMLPTIAGQPQRRTLSSANQVFDQGNEYGSALFGDQSQGLLDGGLGIPGAGDEKPKPTEMMLALMRSMMGR